MNPVTCTTITECRELDGKRVEVLGVYTPWLPGGSGPTHHIKITLDDSTGPFLEAGHDPRHRRTEAEIRRFSGKRVRVVGTFVRSMPQTKPDHMQQLAGSCISDIDTLELVE